MAVPIAKTGRFEVKFNGRGSSEDRSMNPSTAILEGLKDGAGLDVAGRAGGRMGEDNRSIITGAGIFASQLRSNWMQSARPRQRFGSQGSLTLLEYQMSMSSLMFTSFFRRVIFAFYWTRYHMTSISMPRTPLTQANRGAGKQNKSLVLIFTYLQG